MIRPEPLLLSKEQLDVIMTTANAVPPSWRDRYLSSVADRLIGLEPLTTADIVAVADRVRLVMLAVPDNG